MGELLESNILGWVNYKGVLFWGGRITRDMPGGQIIRGYSIIKVHSSGYLVTLSHPFPVEHMHLNITNQVDI